MPTIGRCSNACCVKRNATRRRTTSSTHYAQYQAHGLGNAAAGDFLDELVINGVAEVSEVGREHRKGAGATNHIILVVGQQGV